MSNLIFIKEWVKALRSGEYQQGRGCLRSRDDKFCCLGVLCDLTNRKEWEVVFEEDDYYAILDEENVLPKNILSFLDLEEREPNFKISLENPKLIEILEENYKKEDRINTWGYYSLTELNDTWKLNFSQIADILEEEFLR